MHGIVGKGRVGSDRPPFAGPCALLEWYYRAYMTMSDILTLLVAERDKLNRAIETLQGDAKRRGRPPKNPFVSMDATAPKKRRPFSLATRRKMAAAQKKR